MSEHWERIIEIEIQFYLRYPVLKAEIEQKLLENELDIKMPVTRIDELGCLNRQCPNTETQAIHRVMKRDSLIKQLDRATKRAERLLNALNQLSNDNLEIIEFMYLDDSPYLTHSRIASLLGYRNIQELYKARDDALKSVLSIYESEREEQEREFSRLRKKHRDELARGIRLAMEKAN